MDFLPLWIWPLAVCGLAIALRLALPGGARKVQGNPRRRASLQSVIHALPGFGWVGRGLWRQTTTTADEPVAILGRKVVGPQQSILLVRIWDEEIAVCLQVGSPATVLTQRRKTPETADQLVADGDESGNDSQSFRDMLERQCN